MREPQSQEPEAGLCLSQPLAQLAEEAVAGQWWPGSAQGPSLAVTLAVGVCSLGHGPTAGPVYRHICIFINKAFCSLPSCLPGVDSRFLV